MYTYLALGDSYTIGEQVLPAENFPNQTVALLRAKGLAIAEPVIIATTGWTTDELAAAIEQSHINESFDFVTLLIGVNNQYRGRDLTEYKIQFEALLQQAIAFAGNQRERVFVLSVPDWGVTPFAEGKDRQAIAQQIDDYNMVNKSSTLSFGCHYTDVTESSRLHGADTTYLTPDGLHYSAREYGFWAEQLCPLVDAALA